MLNDAGHHAKKYGKRLALSWWVVEKVNLVWPIIDNR